MDRLDQEMSAIKYAAKEVGDEILLLDLTETSACLVGYPENTVDGWVLVDTGPGFAADFIIEHAQKRYGRGSPPQAIILTHGHVTHAGSAVRLADFWNVPVYMHQLEMPYLTALVDYPRPDQKADQALDEKMDLYPKQGINLSFHAVPLPLDRSVPGMRGWTWVHTPGHTIGHVSLFRPRDRVLIAGDAFSTEKHDILHSLLNQPQNKPEEYITIDLSAARNSVMKLRDLDPSLAIPSHGKPMGGEELREHLDILLSHYNRLNTPEQAIYTED